MKTYYAHILIVDDDRLRSIVLAEQLQQLGYAVSTASSAQQPLALISTQSFDLALLAVEIASAGQFALLTQIKQDETLHHLPIITLASSDQVNQAALCLELGAMDYILVPANPILLKTRINNCLERVHLKEQLTYSWQAFNEMERLADDLRLTILPLSMALSAESDFNRLLEKIVVEAMKICHADAGTLYLRTADNYLNLAIVRVDSLGIIQGGTTDHPVQYPPLALYDEETGYPNHQNVAAHVVHTGESQNLPDIYQASGFDFTGVKAMDEQNNYRSTSCLTVPLKNPSNGVIGALQLLNARNDEQHVIIPFDVYHQLVVESLASLAAIVLHNQILRERQESLQEFQQQLQIARKIQEDFFPAELPQPGGWELVARFHPAREVAGDFYDSFLMPQGNIALVIADVCDKGLAAALFMSLVRSLIRAFSQQHSHLHRIYESKVQIPQGKRPFLNIDAFSLLNTITLTNTYIESNHRQTHMFATLFFGLLDPSTGQLTYVNAGHNPPIIFDASGIKSLLAPTGPAVGLYPDAAFQVHHARIEAGDTFLAYTDGITEARNLYQEAFTTQRLLSLLPGQAHSAPSLLKHIDQQVHHHITGVAPYDDITMLAARRLPFSS